MRNNRTNSAAAWLGLFIDDLAAEYPGIRQQVLEGEPDFDSVPEVTLFDLLSVWLVDEQAHWNIFTISGGQHATPCTCNTG